MALGGPAAHDQPGVAREVEPHHRRSPAAEQPHHLLADQVEHVLRVRRRGDGRRDVAERRLLQRDLAQLAQGAVALGHVLADARGAHGPTLGVAVQRR
jgi:hypothetical protein